MFENTVWKQAWEERGWSVCVSDGHPSDGSGAGQEFWKLLDKCRPEGVLLGGDLMVAKEDAQVRGAEKFVGKLTEKYPVWYANGNHERRLLEETETLGKNRKTVFPCHQRDEGCAAG